MCHYGGSQKFFNTKGFLKKQAFAGFFASAGWRGDNSRGARETFARQLGQIAINILDDDPRLQKPENKLLNREMRQRFKGKTLWTRIS